MKLNWDQRGDRPEWQKNESMTETVETNNISCIELTKYWGHF